MSQSPCVSSHRKSACSQLFVYLFMYWKHFKVKISVSCLECHCLAQALARRRASLNSCWVNECCSLYSVFHLWKGVRVKWKVLCKRTIKQAVKGSILLRWMAFSFVLAFTLSWHHSVHLCDEQFEGNVATVILLCHLHFYTPEAAIGQVPTMYPVLHPSQHNH